MVLLGLGILIASLSFLCYRFSPRSWSFLGWFQQYRLEDCARKQNDEPVPTIHHDDQNKVEDTDPSAVTGSQVADGRTKPTTDKVVEIRKDLKSNALPPSPTIAPSTTTQDEGRLQESDQPVTPTRDGISKDFIDRKAMPPPPNPSTKVTPETPSTQTTTTIKSSKTTKTPTIPTFSHQDDDPEDDQTEGEEEERYVPSFPAANSAQRASGGTRAPPRLNALSTPRTTTSSTTTSTNLMLPPPRPSPLPNRGAPAPSSLSSSLNPPPTHTVPPPKPRKKVLLTPGHSPLDWAHLTSSSSASSSLTGLPPNTPYLRVPPSLLKTMTGRKGKNAWTVLGGKVYNITPYLPYHPGGEPELLRCAGRDGTRLFGEVHPWVNYEGMLSACLVGVAVEEGEVTARNSLEEMD